MWMLLTFSMPVRATEVQIWISLGIVILVLALSIHTKIGS